MLEETRRALILAGERGPYVLLPHSMSGLEAIYWAQKYPQEIKAIIGLDMAFPEAYEKASTQGRPDMVTLSTCHGKAGGTGRFVVHGVVDEVRQMK